MKKLILLILAFAFSISSLKWSDAAEEKKAPLTNSDRKLIVEKWCGAWTEWGVENTYCDTAFDEDYDVVEKFRLIKDEYHQDTNKFLNKNLAKISGTTFTCDQKRDKTAIDTNIVNYYYEREFELYKYKAAIFTLADMAKNDIPQSGEPIENQTALKMTLKRSEMILREAMIAEKALKISLASYKEMRVMYPLHKELECLIIDLHDLRAAWELLVDQIARMPAKFINAAYQ